MTNKENLINGILMRVGDLIEDKDALRKFLEEQDEFALEFFALDPLPLQMSVISFSGTIPIIARMKTEKEI